MNNFGDWTSMIIHTLILEGSLRLVLLIVADDMYAVVSAKCHGTFCTGVHQQPVHPIWPRHIARVTIFWQHVSVLFASMICYNTICTEQLVLDRRFVMRFVIGISIFCQRYPPEIKNNHTHYSFLSPMPKRACWLTHFSKLSPSAENAPPSVDSHDIKSSSSTFCHVNALARRHQALSRTPSLMVSTFNRTVVFECLRSRMTRLRRQCQYCNSFNKYHNRIGCTSRTMVVGLGDWNFSIMPFSEFNVDIANAFWRNVTSW